MGKSWLFWIALAVAISPRVCLSGGAGSAGGAGGAGDEVRVPESACAMPGDPSAGRYARIEIAPAVPARAVGAGPERVFVPSKSSPPASQPAGQSKGKPAAPRVASAQSQPADWSVLAFAVRSAGKMTSTSQPDRPAGRSSGRADLPRSPGEVISVASVGPAAGSGGPAAPVSAGEFSPSSPDRLVARSPNYELICRVEGTKTLFTLTHRDKPVFASVSGDQLLHMLSGLEDEAAELICSVRLAPAEK